MTTPLQTVESEAGFSQRVQDHLRDGLYEIESVLLGMNALNKVRADASGLIPLNVLLTDVDGHPC